MDAMSSSLLSNAYLHPKCIRSFPSPPNKYIPDPFFHISSSQITHEIKPKQEPKSTSTTLTRAPTPSIKHSLHEQTVNGSATATTYSPPEPVSLQQLKRKSPTSTPQTSTRYFLFNALDEIVNNFIDPPLRPSVDPKHVLANNFAPVEELPPTDCPIIEGTLPPCLDGAYIRNGPNPQYLPKGPYHLFDGDGMLHSLRISNGSATLCSRYVKTYKYNVELDAGSPVFPNVFSGFNGLPAMAARGALSAARVLTGQYNPTNGIGLANTSLAFFGDKLFALGESDLPYQIRVTPDGDIETIGRYDFEGKFSSPMNSMTAHPKMDAQTGETFAFRYSPMSPFLTFFRFDASGSKQPDVPIYSLTTPAFLHDFAITKKYAIFADIQIGMTTNPMELLSGSGSVVGADTKKVPRIGVIPRYANDESEMRWFDVPGFNIIHAINAWDEEDSIVLIAPNILSVEHTLERMELIHASVEKVRINLKTGMVTRSPIATKNLDFGVINPAFTGRKNKYGYAAVGDPMPKISGVVKLDWSSKGGREAGCRMFGSGCYGGEPFFVPKSNDPANMGEEDDGYLVTYVHDENSRESRFLVMDAKSPTLDIVAAVRLPRRVPYGFHGLFVRDTDLSKL
ncbi:9-cis-epoxycarotenoid dioxygenase protein [Thalictrum thalictroides]|uniref:9-cis-epoxycarotenoid dioxygenase protein n=1 Tax=Thalictrum thalictroides TaxID=46969 RepID=A0A7J6WSL9_THATH|nr:9-cis-epoxycarotenoid dioxygenase protein [Thalictrum thalictroides]